MPRGRLPAKAVGQKHPTKRSRETGQSAGAKRWVSLQRGALPSEVSFCAGASEGSEPFIRRK
jgi:hypothetical protein